MRDGAFARLGRNIAWLLGGRGAAGMVSLAYLALAARALGPARFGNFSMAIAYGGVIASLAQFQSWQAIMRYGAAHLHQERPDRLARLLGFTATLDWSSAVLGAVVAVLGVALIGPALGWSAEQRHGAELFAAVLLLCTGGTPAGALRLFDRFDLLVYAETVGPVVRLIGAGAVWARSGGAAAMLVVWAFAAFAEMAAGWLALLRTGSVRLALGPASFREARRENPRIMGFMFKNSFSSSLGIFGQQVGTLAVGLHGGAVAAGGFRVAGKLATALAKPVQVVTRALYPELARFAAGGDRRALRRFAAYTTWTAATAAAAVVTLTWWLGPAMLRAISGRQFAFASPWLVLLTVAAAIDLCGIALEPVLNVHGAAGRILAARVLGATVYLGALLILLPRIGVAGACIAAVIGAASLRGALAVAAVRLLRPPVERDDGAG